MKAMAKKAGVDGKIKITQPSLIGALSGID
jgi:hypothetical protein